MTTRLRTLVDVAVCLSIVTLAAYCALDGHVTFPTATLDRNEREDGAFVVTLIINSTCNAARDPAFKVDYQNVVLSMDRLAKRTGIPLVTSGIATDRTIDRGLSILKKFGPWNEITIGRGRSNSLGAQMNQVIANQDGTVPTVIIAREVVDRSPIVGRTHMILSVFVGPAAIRGAASQLDSTVWLEGVTRGE